MEPQIPQNTGNIARTCACTGAHLHLVGPMGFEVTDAKLKRAGLDYWNKLDITNYIGLDDFFAKTKGDYYFFTTKAKQAYTNQNYKNGAFLIFGREDKGLPETLLSKYSKTCVRLPMLSTLRSLNLSNTVAIATYEVLRQWNFEGLDATLKQSN